jgi:outer membrane protein OmpA-like peptidoglycan-associated protein
LPLGKPDDSYEREADRVATQAMRAARNSADGAPVTGERRIFRAGRGSGGGRPLEVPTREFFEQRMNADFSGVRVHADDQAARSSRSLGARAFTVGGDIWFGAGEYAPQSGTGKRLLAHELAHTLQQRTIAPRIQRTPVVTNCDAAENANILRAHTVARSWLARALSRLAHPENVSAELAYHFRADAHDARTLGMIRDELRAVQDALAREQISYNCAPAGHPDCAREFIQGFAQLSSYDANFCEPLAQDYTDALVTILIHEAIHALAPGIPDGPYLSDPDYPGMFPLSNTDAYSQLVHDLATDLLAGVAPEPQSESTDTLPGRGYQSSSGAWGIQTNLHGFPENDATLTPEAHDYLEYLLEDWDDHFLDEEVVLRLAGHTDAGREHEAGLGRRRAEAVRDYLLARLPRRALTQPIDVQIVDFGTTRPFTTGRSARAQALNRRVEIEVRRLSARRPASSSD